jgi:carboxymethylenebutenolidase
VAFYGVPAPSATEVADKLTTPLLCVFAELDRNPTKNAAALIATMLDTQKTFAFHIYDGVNHAFRNDTGARYDAAAACAAWSSTTDFLSAT